MPHLKKYITLVSLSLISMLMANAQTNTFSEDEVRTQSMVKNHLIAAREYLKGDHEDLAKLEIDSALILAPTNWVANTMMGDLMSEREDYLHALLSYDKAILVNTQNPTLYFKRAELHIKLNNHRAYIIGDYDRAIDLAPDRTLYYVRKASYYAHTVNPKNFKTDFQSAIQVMDEALLIDPDNPELLYLKSKYLLGDKQSLAALTEVNKAIVLASTNDTYLAHRGNVNFDISRFRAALTDFNRAIKVNNQNSDYYKYRGHTNFNLDKYAAAYDDYSSAIDLIITKIAKEKGTIDPHGHINKELRMLLLFRGMSLVHDDRPYDGCDDFKRASMMGETKARNYIRKYCN
jgi:tetratricopeptide (TPR) repeat protein